VSGVVVDNTGEPILGVFVEEVGTTNYVVTDFYGKFNTTTQKDNSVLNFRFIGMLPKTVRIRQDRVLYIVLEEDTINVLVNYIYVPRYFSIGANYDVANSLFGISFSNGYNERPLIHFEDFGRFVYKISVQSNFGNDYAFEGNFGVLYPTGFFDLWHWVRYVQKVSINYTHKNLSDNVDFRFNKISIKGYTYSRFLQSSLFLEPAFQSLNNENNFGVILGAQKGFGKPRFYSGLSVGYFSDYWIYSAYIRGRIGWSSFSYQLTYDRINNHDFFNVGLSYLFNWRRR